MLTRLQFRGRFSAASPDLLKPLIQRASDEAKHAVSNNVVMTVGLYQWGRQLFLYVESLVASLDPETLLPSLLPVLETWPEGETDRKWAYMYPVFYHDIPDSPENWKRGCPEKRIGRIALLRHESLFSYVYHHHALVREGKLCGDRYQLISLHEDILFSYLEEPRTPWNLCHDPQQKSACIDDWMKADPESHFVPLPGSHGQNFLILPSLFNFGQNDPAAVRKPF